MRLFALWPWLLSLLALAVALLYWPDTPSPEPSQAISSVLSGETEQFAHAVEPRDFRFPHDHGPHTDYRNEWWYVTAHMRDEKGHVVTLMMTFFRFGISPQAADSGWQSPQVYMAHYAVLDQAGQHHYHGERLQRAAHGLAGASREPYRVWLDDWALSGNQNDLFPATLALSDHDFALSLDLQLNKPPVLQGQQGLSQKSAAPGNASYYYAYTRLAAEGHVTIDGATRRLSGQAWMDREFGTSALADDQVGWDWFSLQLDNNQELMIYQMRRRDGSIDPHSHGAWIDSGGDKRHLAADDYQIEVLDHWQAPDGLARYPARWRIRLTQPDMELELAPLRADQEMRSTRFRYYEGAIAGQGVINGESIKARGFVEMTGRAEE